MNRFWVAIGLCLLLSEAAVAQEIPKPSRQAPLRYYATGTYSGTRHGSRTRTLQGGDRVEETTDCSVKMEFRSDGTIHYDAGRYFYQKVYYKRTTTGGYLKATATREADDSRPSERDGTMSVWVTPDRRLWRAQWQPRVEVPGTETLVYELTDATGRVLGPTRAPPGQAPAGATVVTVYCDVHVLWGGIDMRGKSYPLLWKVEQPDANPERSWIMVSAAWNLTPVLRR